MTHGPADALLHGSLLILHFFFLRFFPPPYFTRIETKTNASSIKFTSAAKTVITPESCLSVVYENITRGQLRFH